MKDNIIQLSQKDIPEKWYNVLPDFPEPLPPELHPGTKEPTILPPPLLAAAVNEQEYSPDRYIDIPEEVRDAYPGKDILQIRGNQPAGQPQAQYSRRTGILQQERGYKTPDYRNRRRPVGQLASIRLRPVRA